MPAFRPITRRRVVVTGLGAVTPLGPDVPTTWQLLLAGARGGRPLRDVPHYFPTVDPKSPFTSAQMNAVYEALPCRVACPVLHPGFAPTAREPRCHRMALAAASEALRDAGLLLRPVATEGDSNNKASSSPATLDGSVDRRRVGVNIGMGIPSVTDVSEATLHLLGALQQEQQQAAMGVQEGDDDLTARMRSLVKYKKIHPFLIPKILGNMAAGAVAIQHQLQGPIASSVTACATGAHCIGEAARWIQFGHADIAVCGATEAAITPVGIAGFCRMNALSSRTAEEAASASSPFDVNRDGFVMGEGAGILVLEERSRAVARGAKIYGEVRGFGVASDGHHVSSPHPNGRGQRQCIREAFADAETVRPSDVWYLNAHATSTPLGDEIELASVMAELRPPSEATPPLRVSSSKGALGHLLGAAGSVEAIIALMALKERVAPPNVNLTQKVPHDSTKIDLITEPTALVADAPLCGRDAAVMSTSFGFGGSNTALLFTSGQDDD